MLAHTPSAVSPSFPFNPSLASSSAKSNHIREMRKLSAEASDYFSIAPSSSDSTPNVLFILGGRRKLFRSNDSFPERRVLDDLEKGAERSRKSKVLLDGLFMGGIPPSRKTPTDMAFSDKPHSRRTPLDMLALLLDTLRSSPSPMPQVSRRGSRVDAWPYPESVARVGADCETPPRAGSSGNPSGFFRVVSSPAVRPDARGALQQGFFPPGAAHSPGVREPLGTIQEQVIVQALLSAVTIPPHTPKDTPQGDTPRLTPRQLSREATGETHTEAPSQLQSFFQPQSSPHSHLSRACSTSFPLSSPILSSKLNLTNASLSVPPQPLSAVEPTFNFAPCDTLTHKPSASLNLTFTISRKGLHAGGDTANTSGIPTYPSLGGISLRHLLNLPALPAPITGSSLPRVRPKPVTCPLPPCVEFLSQETASQYIRLIVKNEHLVPMNLLIIDTRPFTEYVNGHVADSLNISLPSTLLRRPNFNLGRIINSLSDYEQSVFQNYEAMNHPGPGDVSAPPDGDIPSGPWGLPAVLLYDNSSCAEQVTSVPIAHMAAKFAGDAWSAPVYILNGGLDAFRAAWPLLVECGTNQSLNMPPTPRNGGLSRSNSEKSTGGAGEVVRTRLRANSRTATEAPRLPTTGKPEPPALRLPVMDALLRQRPLPLARFVLPSPRQTVFKTRHHEEVASHDPSLQFEMSLDDCCPIEVAAFPRWVTEFMGEKDMEGRVATLFLSLEALEKARLEAIYLHNSKPLDPRLLLEASHFQLPVTGLELGAKNRYKDIIPYEHARVRLLESRNGSDYINASHIDLERGADGPKYIACQGPLENTIGDFWRMIVEQECPLIISLTDTFEGGMAKCAAFWESGEYHSNGLAKVSELETVNGLHLSMCNMKMEVAIRRLLVTVDHVRGRSVNHEVLQIQVLSWPDMGTSVESVDLLQLVMLKRHLLLQINDGASVGMNERSGPVVVHCLAGCGRTGTFCAIDASVDALLANDFYFDRALGYDPVCLSVNLMRKCRLSMVQTLRQYMLAYETIFVFVRTQLGQPSEEFERRNQENLQMGILKRFVEEYKRL